MMLYPVDSFLHRPNKAHCWSSLGLSRQGVILACIFHLCFIACWPIQATPQGDVNEAFQLATAAMREGRLEEAGAGFENNTHTAATFVGAHFNLGLGREAQGRLEDERRSHKK